MIAIKNLTVGFYSRVLQNGFPQTDFFFFPVAVEIFCSEPLFT